MAIPHAQLDIWVKQGPITSSSLTYQSIQNALTHSASPIRDFISNGNVKIYLQGSYKNDTNIRGDSDVDVIVELIQTFHSNKIELTPAEYQLHESTYSTASYQWADFRTDVIAALEAYFGTSYVDQTGNKSLKVLPNSGRLRADVVPVTSYRRYNYFRGDSNHSKELGVLFYHRTTGKEIINYPDHHYRHGVIKHQNTGDQYKKIVRILKNARSYLIDKGILDKKKAPSYFLQSLVYNVPDDHFSGDISTATRNVLNYLYNEDVSNFISQNNQHALFGPAEEQWNIPDARETIIALVNLWDKWGTI